MFGQVKSSIGLDIGSSAVKAVELRSRRTGHLVSWVASEPIPPDAIVDGAIIDGASVADAVGRLPFENADMLKRGVPVEGLTFEEAVPALTAVTDNVMLEVQKTFDFFKATAASDHIDRIVLSGGSAQIEGFADAMAEHFGTDIEIFDPFRQLQLDAKKTGDVGALAPTAAVAVGLALRRAGDR